MPRVCWFLSIVAAACVVSVGRVSAGEDGSATKESPNKETQEAAPAEAVVLAFGVDRRFLGDDQTIDTDALVTAVDRRLNATGPPQARVRRLDDGRIEVVTFTADPREVRRIEQKVLTLGTIEFRILANRHDHGAIVDRALAEDGGQVYQLDQNGDRALDAHGRPVLLAWWVPVAKGEEESLLNSLEHAEAAHRKTRLAENECTEFLVVNDDFNVNGSYLVNVFTGTDPSDRPNVLFRFSPTGGRLFGALTGKNLPDKESGFGRRLGIIFDGYLQSAPIIRATISEHGEITGDFTPEEVKDLVDILNAGSLPAPLKKVGERPANQP